MQEPPKKKKKVCRQNLIDWRREIDKKTETRHTGYLQSLGHRENVSFIHYTLLDYGFKFRDILAAKAFGKKKNPESITFSRFI